MSWHTPQDWAGLSSAEVNAKNIALGRPLHVSPAAYWPKSDYYNPKLTSDFLKEIGQKKDYTLEDPTIGIDSDNLSPKALKLNKLDLKKRFPSVDPKYIDAASLNKEPLPEISIGFADSKGEYYSGEYYPELHQEIMDDPEIQKLAALHTQKDTMIESGEWDKLDTISQVHINNQIEQEQKPGQYFGNVTEKNQAYEMKQGPTYEMKQGPTYEMKPVQNQNESRAETKVLNQHDVSVKTFKSIDGATSTLSKGNLSNKTGSMSNLKGDNDVSISTAGDSDAVDGAAYDDYNFPGIGDGNGNDGAAAFSTSKPKKKRKTKTVMETKNVGENVLYNLEPYTYEFILSAMSKEDYAKGGSYEIASRKNIIIKTSGLPGGGAGVPGSDPVLAPGSQLNHHVRSVSLKSVIGLNSLTITSNVHNIEFSVFEPFGASLLDDLHDAAVSVGFDNYLRGIYLLTLKFHGYNDDGKPTPWGGVGKSKFFPMKIINCDLNIKGGGTEYNFSAVPYNANSLEDNRMKITQPMNLRGGSAGELLFQLQEQLNEQQRILWDHGEGGYSIQIVGDPAAVTTGDIKTDSKTELINAADDPDTVETSASILVGPGGEQGKNASDLFNASMHHDSESLKNCSVSVELTAEGKKLSEESMNTGIKEGRLMSNLKFNAEFKRRVYTWNTGTSILDIIVAIVHSSDYIMRQFNTDVNEMNVQANSNGQIPWYKIDYKFVDANDNKTPNRYLIRPYMVDQYIAIPDSAVNKKFNVKEVAREYNYIYTGENRDILDFDLQYNFAFFTAVSAHADKTPGGTGDSVAQSKVITKKNKHLTSPANRDKGKVVIETKLSDIDVRGTTQGGELGSAYGYKQASIIKEQLSNPTGDLINLELEILGDPFYLVQEDFNPGLLPRDEVNAYELKDGSIDANNGEVYLKVNFKTPVDLDEETGTFKGINGAGKYDTSFFGGFFKLISIESTFEEGRFIQRLGLVRLRYQELEAPKGTPEERAHAGEFEWPIDSSKGYKDVHNFNVSFSNVIKGLDTAFNLGPITGEPFSVGSFSKEETQTEANIEDGFHSAATTQSGDLASIGIDQNNLLGNFASGGNPVDGVMSFAMADQKRKNGATNVLSSDKGEGQANVVSGLNQEQIGSVSSAVEEYLESEETVTEKKTVSIDGNKTTTLITKKDGNKVTKIKETLLENDGEQEKTTTEETIGTDKYGGLTREEYYEGKTLQPMDQATGNIYVIQRDADKATRNQIRVKEKCQEAGGTNKECRASVKKWKKESGLYNFKKSSKGRDVIRAKFSIYDRKRSLYKEAS